MLILFDVDNTLLDNDAVVADLRSYLTREVGSQSTADYFAAFDELRAEVGYADYLGALQRYRARHPRDFHVLRTSAYLVDYPFRERVYPGVRAVLEQAAALATTAILSDGDVVFQPLKIERAGLWDAVAGRVMIYVHKEQQLEDVASRYPADHFVMVDDKRRLLEAIKSIWKDRVTTVWVRQGHYAFAADVESYATPDIVLENIGEFSRLSRAALAAAG